MYWKLEPERVRKQLWFADARQKAWMHIWEVFEARRKDVGWYYAGAMICAKEPVVVPFWRPMSGSEVPSASLALNIGSPLAFSVVA